MCKKSKIIEKFILGGEMMAEAKKRVSIGLTDKQFELVEKIAKEKGFSKSAIFVLALEEYARKEADQKK